MQSFCLYVIIDHCRRSNHHMTHDVYQFRIGRYEHVEGTDCPDDRVFVIIVITSIKEGAKRPFFLEGVADKQKINTVIIIIIEKS
jgi:hypothetical protein